MTTDRAVAWAVDHLVVAARTLDDGAAWCEATLGVAPAPGGVHPLMGTHNRLLAIGSARFPRAYLEIIAIDPNASPPARVRWFDLDQPALQQAIAKQPRLIHWVARCDDLGRAVDALRSAGIDRGEVLTAERPTARGLLRWQISVRPDGQRLFGGALPTLIQWGDVHPADSMPASDVALSALTVSGLPPEALRWLPETISARPGPPGFKAALSTGQGPVDLTSPEYSE